MNNTLKTVKICVNNKPLDGSEPELVIFPLRRPPSYEYIANELQPMYSFTLEPDHSIRFGSFGSY